MKQLFLFFLSTICISIQNLSAQTMLVQQGACLLSNGNVTITCVKSGIIGDGKVDLSSAVLKLKGNKNINVGTAAGFTVKELNIATTNANVILTDNVSVKNAVTLVSGLLNLNAKNLLLDSTATITGENENTRITGANGGEIIISLSLNNPQAVNPGHLGATITSSKNLGLVTIKRGHKEQNGSTAFNKSILRYYNITPANNSQLAATIRLSYLDTELNSVSEPAATIFQSTNNGTSWTNMNEDAIDVNLNFIEKKNVSSFEEFTISNPLQSALVSNINNRSIKINDQRSELKAWPLPAEGPFNLLINGVTENTAAMIYDVSGKLMQKIILSPGSPRIISNLSPGIYFIKTTNASMNTLKIIVN